MKLPVPPDFDFAWTLGFLAARVVPSREGVEEATALLGTWLGLDTNLIQELNAAQSQKTKIKSPRLKGKAGS